MNDFEQQLHRTWIQALLEFNRPEIAAIAIDANINLVTHEYEGFNEWVSDPKGIIVDVPISAWTLFRDNLEVIKKTILGICKGHIIDCSGNIIDVSDNSIFGFEIRVALIEVEEDWKNVARRLIDEAQNPNQGVITEKVFERRGQSPHVYNEMKFGSQSEIRIAQEFEARKVLFFPLPLAVRCETGNFYQDHREIDFLICHDGVWGILEVSHHVDRYEKDKEKDAWFKKSGILCVEHYTAEKCFNFPKQVTDEFLSVLAKFKR